MKNNLKSILCLILTAVLIGCGKTSNFENQFSGDDLKAVLIMEKSLPRGSRIEECKVVKGKLPLACMETEYKLIRDEAYKARLDYRACVTRGLESAAKKNVDLLVELQNTIREKSESLNSSSPEYLFVLAKVKERTGKSGLSGYITILDAKTLEKVKTLQVTTPLYNNAVMVTEALNGTLANPTYTGDASSVKSDNPIVNFILSCNPK